MDPELVRELQSIDPQVLGKRIKRARLAQGLTQSQLASQDVSIAYVSRIEAGQRRPDGRLLDTFAVRLSTTVEEFVLGISRDAVAEMQLALDHAELELASGNGSEALRRAGEALERIGADGMADLLSRARLLKALSLEALGEINEAILDLELLAQGVSRDLLWIRTVIALCRCYRESGDLNRAIDIGRFAMDELESHGLMGLDEAIQIVLTVAAAYFERGDTGHAARMCRSAVEEAERLGSPVARASAYWNASVMESRRGAVEAAIPLAQRALALIKDGQDSRNLARLRSQLGMFQLRLDPPELVDAHHNLELAGRELAWSSASPVDIARNDLAKARADYLSGDDEGASQVADAIYASMREIAPMLAADAKVLVGQIAASSRDIASACEAYQAAVLSLSAVGSDRNAAQLWFELGTLLDEAGDSATALDAFRRAAASTGLTARPSSRQHV